MTTFDITLAVAGDQSVVLSHKTGKVGSIAMALAYATPAVRQEIASGLYATWFANGNFRPLLNDMLDCGLVNAQIADFIRSGLPAQPRLNKDEFMTTCRSIYRMATNKRNKEGVWVAPKGKKGFVYSLLGAINQANPEYVSEVIEG